MVSIPLSGSQHKPDNTARVAATSKRAASKQAIKVKAAWVGKTFRKAFTGTRKMKGTAGAGTVLIGKGV